MAETYFEWLARITAENPRDDRHPDQEREEEELDSYLRSARNAAVDLTPETHR